MRKYLLFAIFRRFRKLIIMMVVIAGVCFGIVMSLVNARGAMEKSFDAFLTEYHTADATISVSETVNADTAGILAAVPGIARVESRLTSFVQFHTPSGRLLGAYVSTMHEGDLEKIYKWEGPDQLSGNEILIQRKFAKDQGLKVGDVLTVRTEEEERSFRIAGTVSSPENIEGSRLEGLGTYYTEIGYIYVPAAMLETETEKQYDRMMAEWKEKEGEYLQAKEDAAAALEDGERQLADAWAELEKQEKEFEEKRAELKEQIRTLTNARLQLVLGRNDLNTAETTAAEMKEQSGQAMAQIESQILELEDRQSELEEVRNELTMLQVRLEDARGRLIVMRGELRSGEIQMGDALRIMRAAKALWDRIRAAGGKIKIPEELLDGEAARTVEEIEEILREKGITAEGLDTTIAEAEDGTAQIRNGIGQIQEGIRQISETYLPEIQDYLEQTEQGLEVIAESRDALKQALAGMTDGLRQIEEFEEIAPENRETLEQTLQEVEEGIRAINSGIEEAETALTEGREQLETETVKAEETKQETNKKLAAGAEKLEDALRELQTWEGYTPLRNEFQITFDEGVTDRRAVLDAALAALNNPNAKGALYEDTMLYHRIQRENIDPWDGLGLFLPIIFALLVLLVLFLFLSLMIKQFRRENGIFRALGFTITEIRSMFCGICLLMVPPALAIGVAVHFPFLQVFYYFYGILFEFPHIVSDFNWGALALYAGALTLGMQATALISTAAINGVHPAEIMSRQFYGAGAGNRRESRLIARAKPLTKWSLKALARNKVRFVFCTLCLAASTAILFASAAMYISKLNMESDIFDTRIRYNCQVLFTEGTDGEELEKEIRAMPCVKALEKTNNYSKTVTFGGASWKTTVMAMDPDGRLLAVLDEQGRPMRVPDEGIVLDTISAEKLGAAAGDTVELDGVPLKVAAVSKQTGFMTSTVSEAQAAVLEGPYQVAWMLEVTEEGEKELLDRLSEEGSKLQPIFVSALRVSIHEWLKVVEVVCMVALFFSVVLGLFIIININQTNLLEQKRELSILRALGFQRRDISRHWYIHSVLYFALSLILGIPVGIAITGTTFLMINTDSRRIFFTWDPRQFLFTIGVLFLFLTCAHLWSMRMVKKWSLVENIKDID